MSRLTQFRSSRGFTLIEMMVVVTIAAVMLGIGVPSFKGFIAGQRAKTAASEFASAAVYARSEAIKRNAEVGVVSAAGGWQDGWTITAGAVTLGNQAAYTGLTFTVRDAADTAVTQVVYLGSGRLKQSSAPSLRVTGSDGSHGRCVSFDLSGLPKTRMGNC